MHRTIVLACAALALFAIVPFVEAQTNLAGQFVRYEVAGRRNDRATAGVVSQEVLADYGDGRVKVRWAIDLTDTHAVVERNVSATRVRFPVVPSGFGPFDVSYPRNQVVVRVRVELVGTETVIFNGQARTINVTRWEATWTLTNETTARASLNGTLRSFRSGLVYQVLASGQSLHRTQPVAGQFSAKLLATSLDVDAPSAVRASQLGELLAQALSARDGTLGPLGAREPSPSGGRGVEPWVVSGVAGIVAVAFILGVVVQRHRSRRTARPAPAPGTPPHWVQAAFPYAFA